MDDNEPKPQRTTSTTEPYKPSQPLLNTTIKDAENLYKSGGLNYQYYPGETVAPVSPETGQAWSAIAQRAQAGSPLTDSAKGYYGDVLSGKYLNAEAPGFDSVLRSARNDVNANKAASGRYGSGSHDAAVAEALGGLRYQNYAQERGYQDAAARYAPALAQQDYYDANQLLNVGQQRQGQLQDQINEGINRWNFDQNSAANAIALAQSLAGGNLGATTKATQPVQGGGYSPFGQVLGTALQVAPYFLGV